MKRIVLLASIFVLACGSIAYSQKYIRNGKTFEQVKTNKSITEAFQTGFTWKSSDGKEYPIYLSSKGGVYIIKKSRKTGKNYKQYLPKDIADQIKSQNYEVDQN